MLAGIPTLQRSTFNINLHVGTVGGVSDVEKIDEVGEQCPPAVTLVRYIVQ
jgi:hypothetical protein